MTLKRLSHALALIATFSSFSHSTFAVEVPSNIKIHTEQVLNRGNSAEPSSLDPSLATGSIESNILNDLFETLVVFDANSNVQPGCAESWETIDNKKFTFNLRKNLKWSDGIPLSADDFVFGFQRLANPQTGADYAEYLTQMNIKNAKKVIRGELKPQSLGIYARDQHTLIMELESPLGYLPDMLAHQATMPLPKHVIEKYGSQWTHPENMVSNGAFKLQKWVVNERIELVKNPHYWDASTVVLNQVNHLPIAAGNPELNRYLAGGLDITYEVPSERFEALKEKYPNELYTAPKATIFYYLPNLKQPPLDDPKVRKALALTIDRDVIADKVLGRGEIPNYTLIPNNISGISTKAPQWTRWTQDQRITEAKRLLQEAGFNDKNPLSFTVLYDTKELNKKITLAVASMWQKNLGVRVTIKNQEWKTYLSERQQGSFELVRASWLADYNEASTFLNLLESSNTLNEGKYKNKDYDALLQASLLETNPEKRAQLYQQALDIFDRDMPVIPVHQESIPKLVKPYVKGYVPNSMNVTYSKNMYIAAH